MTSLGGKSNIQGQANPSDYVALSHISHVYNMQSQVFVIDSSVSSLLYEEL